MQMLLLRGQTWSLLRPGVLWVSRHPQLCWSLATGSARGEILGPAGAWDGGGTPRRTLLREVLELSPLLPLMEVQGWER